MRQVRGEVPDPAAPALLDVDEGARGPGLRAHVSQDVMRFTLDARPF